MQIPWWAMAYLILLLVWSLFGYREDQRDGGNRFFALAGLILGLGLILFVAGYWDSRITFLVGRWGLPILFFSLIYEFWSGYLDVKSSQPDPELSDEENRISTIIALCCSTLLLLPAYALAAFATLRAWK
jgi:amino acid permease